MRGKQSVRAKHWSDKGQDGLLHCLSVRSTHRQNTSSMIELTVQAPYFLAFTSCVRLQIARQCRPANQRPRSAVSGWQSSRPEISDNARARILGLTACRRDSVTREHVHAGVEHSGVTAWICVRFGVIPYLARLQARLIPVVVHQTRGSCNVRISTCNQCNEVFTVTFQEHVRPYSQWFESLDVQSYLWRTIPMNIF